ncbi:MAG: M24 family metallopeptidase [Christensenellales bacterium]|jgi:Xaa-Pro dipeptidase
MNFEARVTVLQKKLVEKGLDACFLTRRFAIGYYTGAFTPWSSALFIPANGQAQIITFIVDVARVQAQSYYTPVSGWAVKPFDRVTEVIRENKLEKGAIGFEIGTSIDPGSLTASEYLAVVNAFPAMRIENILDEVNTQQLIKTPEEVELLKRAAESVDLGMQYAYENMCIGMTETELAGWAELGMRKAGHMFNWCVTGTEIGAGENQCRPFCFTSIPGHKRIQYGEIVTIDIHSMYDLYISDLALNAIIGKPTPAQRKLADDWQRLAEYIMAVIKPGAICDQLFKMIYQKATEMGVEKLIVPSFSHGLGMDARIPPAIGPGNPFELQEDMAIELILQMTVPGVGGMRLEYPVMIGSNGSEPLSKMPLDLYIKDF